MLTGKGGSCGSAEGYILTKRSPYQTGSTKSGRKTKSTC